MLGEWLALPGDVSSATALILGATTLAASFISGVMGLGGATLLLGVMAILLPAAVLIPLHAVVQVASTGFRGLLLLPHVHRSLLAPFVAGSLFGSAVGGALVIQLPAWAIQFGIALFIVWSVFGRVGAAGRYGAALIGLLSGFLTMWFGATGPFVTAFVRNQQLPRLAHVGTQAVMMTFQHAIKMLIFGLFGFAFGRYFGLLVLMIVCSLIGTALGRLVLGAVDERLFRKLLNGLLLLLAVRLIWQGAVELVG